MCIVLNGNCLYVIIHTFVKYQNQKSKNKKNQNSRWTFYIIQHEYSFLWMHHIICIYLSSMSMVTHVHGTWQLLLPSSGQSTEIRAGDHVLLKRHVPDGGTTGTTCLSKYTYSHDKYFHIYFIDLSRDDFSSDVIDYLQGMASQALNLYITLKALP